MTGAVEVARIDGVDRKVPKTPGEQLDLLLPAGRDAAVPMPLHHPVTVSLRLCMADQIKLSHIAIPCLDVM